MTRSSNWPIEMHTFVNNSFLQRPSGNFFANELISDRIKMTSFLKFSMEVTPLVVLPSPIPSGRNPSIVSHHPGLHSYQPMYSFGSRNKSPPLHPSLYHHEDEMQLKLQEFQQQQRIFFSALSLANILRKTTVTFTSFKTGRSLNIVRNSYA